MRINKPKSLIVFALIALAMSGCGKSSNSAVPITNGLVNGYGVGGVAGGTLGSACTPLTSPISFGGAMYIDSANVIAGTSAPSSSSGYGTVTGGTIQMASQQNYPYNTYGYIVIQAQMIGTTAANAGGTLQLSQAAVQQAAMQSGAAYNGQVPCGQVVAINLGHYNTTLYGGTVTLLINGTIPYQVQF